MRHLFFDTETTGLPENWKAPMTDLDNWPRVIQLAASAYEDDGTLIDSFEILIKPDGWEMPTDKFWTDNGFSQERSIQLGIPVNEALKEFIKYHDSCDTLVAHNISYDYNVLGAEMIRAKMRCNKVLMKFCTKDIGTDYCQIEGPYGYKWPKLEELHFKLFGCDFVGAHQAGSDVEATAKCFFEMKKLGLIKIP